MAEEPMITNTKSCLFKLCKSLRLQSKGRKGYLEIYTVTHKLCATLGSQGYHLPNGGNCTLNALVKCKDQLAG